MRILTIVSLIFVAFAPRFLVAAPLTVIEKAPAKKALKIYSDVARYHYLLGNYVYGFVHQSIAEQNTRLSAVDSPEIWQASLYMDANMILRAFDILEARLQGANASEFSVDYRIDTWLSMAEKLYQKTDYQRARKALSYLSTIESSLLPEKYHYLNVQLLLAQGDTVQATAAMIPIERYALARRYLTYNLAMAYIGAQNYPAATVLLENVATISGPVTVNDELIAMVDKAYLALGYLYNQLGRHVEAIDYFKAISLQGMEAEAAMLGYGWALLKSEQFAPALAVWQKLASHEVITPFVRESFIAIPYAFDLLGDKQSAIGAYQNAITRLVKQERALAQEMRASKMPAYLSGLLITEKAPQKNNEPAQPFKGDKFFLRLPEIVNTYDVVSKGNFQQGIRNLEDIYVVVNLLEKLAKDLNELNDNVYREYSLQPVDNQSEQANMTASERELARLREKFRRQREQQRGYLQLQQVAPEQALIAQSKQQFLTLHRNVSQKLGEARDVQMQLSAVLAADIHQMLSEQRDNVRNYLLTARMALAKYNDEAMFNSEASSAQGASGE